VVLAPIQLVALVLILQVAMVVVLAPIQLVALVLILQVEVLVVEVCCTVYLHLAFLLLWRLEMCYRSKVVRVNSFNL
jgi:hypothetical protein